MSTYEPNKIMFPTGLDEIGLKLGLVRLEEETLDNYRRRLYLETRQPSGGSFDEFARSTSRKVGLFDLPVFEINLVVDGDNVPLAPDPVLEVTASKLNAWIDYGDQVLDFSLVLNRRDEAYFLRDVKAAFDDSAYFTCDILDVDYTYRKSIHLAVGTNRLQLEIPRLDRRLVHNLQVQNIRSVRFSDPTLFREEVADLGDLDELGEYYIDYRAGVVFSYDPMGGSALVEYAEFPYRFWWQQVRTCELKDPDRDYLLFTDQIGTEGEATPTLLSSEGAKIVNEICVVHPLEWGT